MRDRFVKSLIKTFDISSNSLRDFKSKVTSSIGLFVNSFRELIFRTFILLNLFSSLDTDFITDIIKELPSFKISRFDSKISEKINNSKTGQVCVQVFFLFLLRSTIGQRPFSEGSGGRSTPGFTSLHIFDFHIR